MVQTKTQVMLPGDRMKARIKKVRDAVRIEGVRVVPASGEGFTEEDMRRLLVHPSAGGFRASGDIEWPNDTFTKRRLAEGSIKLSEGQKDDDKQHRHTSHHDAA